MLIRQIRGTEGQRDAFDDAFHPLTSHTRGRWVSIASAWLQGTSLPPVDLIRVGEVYFVRDGHHRISVARALGQQEIDAVVTVWEVATSPSFQGSATSLSEWAAKELGKLISKPASEWRIL